MGQAGTPASFGYQDVRSFQRERGRLMDALDIGSPLPPQDWLRSLAATEIAFASFVLGSAGDWRICTGIPDDEALQTLRALQEKLAHRLAPLRQR